MAQQASPKVAGHSDFSRLQSASLLRPNPGPPSRTCPPREAGATGSSIVMVLPPFQRATGASVDVPNAEDRKEPGDGDDPVPAELADEHRPGVEEEGLDVEDEEEHRDEGEAHGPAVLGALQLGDAALVRARLGVIRAARRERARDRHDDDHDGRREAEIDEETGAVSHWRNLETGS